MVIFNFYFQIPTTDSLRRSRQTGVSLFAVALDDPTDALPMEAEVKLDNQFLFETENYDLVISMDDLTEDDAAEIIMDVINRTSK